VRNRKYSHFDYNPQFRPWMNGSCSGGQPSSIEPGSHAESSVKNFFETRLSFDKTFPIPGRPTTSSSPVLSVLQRLKRGEFYASDPDGPDGDDDDDALCVQSAA
jgi:hypothetical protein